MKAKFILAGMVALGLCACSNDETLNDVANNASSENNVYMQLSVSLPTDGTRSGTISEEEDDDYAKSSDGTEVGKDYENRISELLVVLTYSGDGSEKLVSSSTTSALTKVDDVTYLTTFSGDALEEYKSRELNVYVYCNPTVALKEEVAEGTFNVDKTYTVTDGTAWAARSMFMASAIAHTAVMPDDFTAYKTSSNPVDLGVVSVERSVARFDYKDGATGGTPYTYSVGKVYTADGTADVSVTLQSVALVNMSKEFYFFRRVAYNAGNDTGKADYENTNLLGAETKATWVIDTDAKDKFDYSGGDLTSHFYYNLSDSESWKWTDLSEIAGNDNDNYGDCEYNIWRYVTENTIPSTDAQKNGITTGVVFKGKINIDGYDIEDGTILYVYNNVLYLGWDAVKAAAEDSDDESTIKAAYQYVVAAWTGDPEEFDETDGDVVAAMEEIGFTGYAPEYTEDGDGNKVNEGYYAYYYYWNRHNDNSDASNMGKMEFAVVRNNVYKLSVTDISKFGHHTPGDTTTPDPDEPDDGDDDETSEYYFKVEVVILPWVVRLNDITF